MRWWNNQAKVNRNTESGESKPIWLVPCGTVKPGVAIIWNEMIWLFFHQLTRKRQNDKKESHGSHWEWFNPKGLRTSAYSGVLEQSVHLWTKQSYKGEVNIKVKSTPTMECQHIQQHFTPIFFWMSKLQITLGTDSTLTSFTYRARLITCSPAVACISFKMSQQCLCLH